MLDFLITIAPMDGICKNDYSMLSDWEIHPRSCLVVVVSVWFLWGFILSFIER